jgi:CIC family chloride channel protein
MRLPAIRTNILSTLETTSIIQTDYLTFPNENLERLVDLISHSNQDICSR